MLLNERPNGKRYRRLGGLRKRDFGGINSKPRKGLENAQTPRRRVHAVLARTRGTPTDWAENEYPSHLAQILLTTKIFAITKKRSCERIQNSAKQSPVKVNELFRDGTKPDLKIWMRCCITFVSENVLR